MLFVGATTSGVWLGVVVVVVNLLMVLVMVVLVVLLVVVVLLLLLLLGLTFARVLMPPTSSRRFSVGREGRTNILLVRLLCMHFLEAAEAGDAS